MIVPPPLAGRTGRVGGRAWLVLLVAALWGGSVAGGPLPALAQQSDSSSQDVQARTQQRLDALRSQIDQLETRRNETEQKERATLKTLEETNREIKVRQALINTYEQRIAQLRDRRDSLRRSMNALEEHLERLMAEYQKRIRHAYKYGRLHDVALVLSAESINQMLIRIKYLRRFALERQRKREAIEATRSELAEQQEGLESTISENQQLLAESRQERKELVALRRQRRDLIEELRARQSEIEDELAQKRESVQQLEAKLEELMASEQRRREEAGEEARAEARALTGSFQQNKGQLPWPVQDGVVTETYGTHVHEVYGTKTVSPGMTIKTEPKSLVRAVFSGTVARVFVMPGYGSCATLRHGSYMTVYCNLSSLYVREGDEVTSGDRIAHAGDETQPLGAAVFFGLFTGNGHVNPRPWLRPQ